MNLNKTLSSAALFLASTALLSASSFAAVVAVAVTAPTIATTSVPTSGTGTTAVYAAPLTFTIAPGTVPAGTKCYYTTNGIVPVALNVVAVTAIDCTSGVTITLTDVASAAISTKVQAVNIPLSTLLTAKLSLIASTTYKLESTISAPVLSPTHSSGPASVQITDGWSYTAPCTIVAPATSCTGLKTLPTIYYTTDGITSPCNTLAATKYVPKTPITITASTILQTAAFATGFECSPVVSGNFDTGSTSSILYFVGAGSSAQFNEFALAAGGPLGDATGGVCGGHHFTAKNSVQVADVRSGVTPADLGHLSLVWDNDTAPTTICAFANLDSTLGVKAFMISNLSTPGGFINITNSTAAGNMLAPFWANATGTKDQASIPAAVLAAIQGQPFNAAITDIRPEDAKFATTRALTALNAARTGLGYGPGPIGSPILESSASGTASFNVVDFALMPGSLDPISHSIQNGYSTINVGAAPVVVFVNTQAGASSASSFHFSDPTLTNIGRFTLAGILNGSITNTSALATSAVTGNPIHAFLREPLSGTYNTMEYSIPASKEIASSQEIGVNPKVRLINAAIAGVPAGCISGSTCTTNPVAASSTGDANHNTGNPLDITIGSALITVNPLGTVDSTGKMIGKLGATRRRAIGTGDMVKVVAKTGGCTFAEANGVITPTGTCVSTNGDAIGYAFWGYGNFSAGNNDAAYTTKYLTVDGVDPINAVYTNGAFPICDGTNFAALGNVCPAVPFTNVINGSYPIWTMYRVVTKSVVPTLVGALVAQAQDNGIVGIVRDFVPTTSMKAFHSHYLQATAIAHNGNIVVAPATTLAGSESGGDMGGAVYTVQEDLNHVAEYGSEIVSVKQ